MLSALYPGEQFRSEQFLCWHGAARRAIMDVTCQRTARVSLRGLLRFNDTSGWVFSDALCDVPQCWRVAGRRRRRCRCRCRPRRAGAPLHCSGRGSTLQHVHTLTTTTLTISLTQLTLLLYWNFTSHLRRNVTEVVQKSRNIENIRVKDTTIETIRNYEWKRFFIYVLIKAESSCSLCLLPVYRSPTSF